MTLPGKAKSKSTVELMGQGWLLSGREGRPYDGGGPPGGGDMEVRVKNLEIGYAVVVERIDGLKKSMEDRFNAVDGRFDGVGNRFDGTDRRLDGMDKRFDRIDRRFDGVDKRFDDLSKKIDKLPNEWAMAKVVFLVLTVMMAAAYFAPRLVAMLPAAQ